MKVILIFLIALMGIVPAFAGNDNFWFTPYSGVRLETDKGKLKAMGGGI